MPNGQIISEYPENANLVQGVANQQLLLLDNVGANDVGLWLPLLPFHKGSFEVTAPGGMAATISLVTSNSPVMPYNGYTVTVGGSASADDVISITITSPALFAPGITASYIVQGGDTTTEMAAGLAAALLTAVRNYASHVAFVQEARFIAGDINVTSSLAVITISWATPIPNNLTPISVNTTVSGGGGTETLAVAQADSALGFVVPGCILTAAGNVVFDQPATWIKATCTNWSSGAISAVAQLVLP